MIDQATDTNLVLLSLCVALLVLTLGQGFALAASADDKEPVRGLLLPAPPLADTLLVADIRAYPQHLALTMVSLQGIVNKKQSRLFLVTHTYDPMWADWLKERGDVDALAKLDVLQAAQLISRFRDELKGQVVTDPNVPATINLATMISGLDGLLITHPDYADNYAERFHLPIAVDLRGRFERNFEAYQWALDNLWPRLSHHALAMLHPSCTSVRDLLIQEKLWVWWQAGSQEDTLATRLKEGSIGHEVLTRSPANIPVFGYPWCGDGIGLGEHVGVSLFSQHGKFLLPTDHASNLSVHRSTRPISNPLNQPRPDDDQPILDPAQVHLSFLVSDGDNLQALLNYFPGYWTEPHGRTVPIGWTISPSTLEIMPDVVDWLIEHRLPGDYFVASVSGIGYVYMEQYGRYTDDQKAVVTGFLSLTRQYMEGLGLTILWPMSDQGSVPNTALHLYASHIPSLEAIFPDYGQHVSGYPQTHKLLEVDGRRIPVFHAINGKNDSMENDLAAFFAEAPRPAFGNVFLTNWFYKSPAIADLARRLGKDYVLVRPDELVGLYLEALGK